MELNQADREHFENSSRLSRDGRRNQNSQDNSQDLSGSEVTKSEGSVTKKIEEASSSVPSGVFLSGAVLSMGASALLYLTGRKEASHFIGQWAPTILILGMYNKLVKFHGSEQNQVS